MKKQSHSAVFSFLQSQTFFTKNKKARIAGLFCLNYFWERKHLPAVLLYDATEERQIKGKNILQKYFAPPKRKIFTSANFFRKSVNSLGKHCVAHLFKSGNICARLKVIAEPILCGSLYAIFID